MRFEIVNQILACTSELRSWESKIHVYDNGKLIDVSDAARGKESRTPPLANNQPTHYPKGSKYRFDTRFKGRKSFGQLKDMLQDVRT